MKFVQANGSKPVDSEPLGSSEQDALLSKEDASPAQPPASSDAGTRAGSSEPTAKTISRSDESLIPVVVQPRIRELFWLDLRSRKEVIETLKEEWPRASEKQISELVDSTLREEMASGVPDGNGNRYVFTKAGLFKVSGSGDDRRSVQITNFQCVSLTPIVRDDGEQKTESLRLELAHENQTETIDLTPEDFRQMNWHFRLFNQRAIVTPGMKEYAVVGIQLAAPRKDKITIYTSTGWYVIEGRPYFLHNDGAIGATEHRREIKAE